MPDTTPVDTCCDRHHYSCHLGEDGPPIYCCSACSARPKLDSRASIGPDSERIRELEDEQVIADALHDVACNNNPGHQDWADCAKSGPCHEDAAAVMPALRAAGLLSGPGDIVVSREALEAITTASSRERLEWAFDVIDAALSQPHPAQEQQT